MSHLSFVRALCLLGLFTVQALIALPAASDSVTLRAFVAGNINDSNLDGQPDQMRDPFELFLAYHAPGTYDWRGIVEFDLSSIPVGSNITGAELFLGYRGASGSPEMAALQLHGYKGDGQVTFADYSVNRPLGPRVSAFQRNDWRTNVTDFLQQALNDRSSFVGFMFRNDRNQTVFGGTVDELVSKRPALNITFSPPPPPPPPPPPVPLPAAGWAGVAMLAVIGAVRAVRRRGPQDE